MRSFEMRSGSSGPLQRLRRIALAASLTAAALVATASPAGASVTIGQLAPGSPPQDECGTLTTDYVQPTVTSGNPYVVPATVLNWTITSWSTNASATPGQRYAMKVFRPLGGLHYMAVGHDSRPLTPGTLNTFATNVPVKAGDVLGLQQNDGSAVTNACRFPITGQTFFRWLGTLPDGASASFELLNNARLNIIAVVEPANTFTLGKLKRNKKKGTATLTVNVPNPGELALAGKGVKKSSGAGAVVAKTVTAPGEVKLKIRAKGKKTKRKLKRSGKVKVKPAVTFTPTGGDPSTQSRRLKLKLKKR